ncbi:hypothetical protein KY385_04710 [Candidatus Parcubacteria bacterium]|nr:hypothetical protein [Candidatus Parcubacteria bacterium]
MSFYAILSLVEITTFQAEAFPEVADTLATQLKAADLQDINGSVAVFGGSARSALLEAVSGIERPIRDLDLAAIGDGCDDERYKAIHMQLNPNDDPERLFIPRFDSILTLLRDNVDFTINEATIGIGSEPKLTASSLAIGACKSKVIQITEGRIKQTESFAAHCDVRNWKKFLRNRTNMPARAGYFVAVFRASGIDIDYDLLDHPRPDKPESAHTFFLGLMVNKALEVDEAERGPGDITATRILFDVYGEMGLTKDTQPQTPEQVAAYCERVNEEHPQLKFRGSAVASLVSQLSYVS